MSLAGSLDSLFFSSNFSSSFGCSLTIWTLNDNRINGTIPSSVTLLHSLQRINLGVNQLTGPIPEGLGSMTALKSIDFSLNELTGSLPASLCNTSSPLTDLIIISNQLTGTLDISSCVNLVNLDLTRNNFAGTAIGPPPGSNNLNVVYLASNQLTNVTDFILSGLITDLNLDWNPIADPSIYEVMPSLPSLRSLSVASVDFNPPCFITGTLPPSIFSLATLRSINLNGQFTLGPIPSITGSSLLTALLIKNNGISGTLPTSIVEVLSKRNALVDLRFNPMCCCGVGPVITWDLANANFSYASYDSSLPRLPPGLKFSSSLQPVSQPLVSYNGTFSGSAPNLGNRTYSGLNCPYLLRAEDEDEQVNFLTGWMLDPEYTLFEGCECDPGLVLVRSVYRGMPIVECMTPPPPSDPWWVKYWWIFIIIGAFAFVVLLLVIWKAASGSRSKLMQEFFDAQRRAKGPPISGQVSIVVTDIEGYSNMMKASPEACMLAVILHNNLLQKARHSCFGYVIESEGDSFSLLFESPVDAVKFCIQAQLLFASAKWPKGLFSEPNVSFEKASEAEMGGSMRSFNSFTIRPQHFSLSFANLSKGPSLNLDESSPKSQHVQGLRVRMGVCTGVIEDPTTPASSHVLEQAKIIGDAACGGQILFCDTTFRHVKDMTLDLGCMTEEGMDLELLKSDKASWGLWWRGRKERLDHEALILHMGDYLQCVEPSSIPTILKQSDLEDSMRLLSLYQVLSPKLSLSRGRSFGNTLRLKPEWIQVDGGYFDAPGALGFPLGSSDKGKADILDPFVATVFIQVDGGKAYASKSNRADAVELHLILLTLAVTWLRLKMAN